MRDLLTDRFGRFFFLCKERIRHRTQAVDSFADFPQLMTEFAVVTKLGNLLLSLAHSGRRRQRLRYGLTCTLRVSRRLGPWPGSFGCAQWQPRSPQRNRAPTMERGARAIEAGDGAEQFRTARFESDKRLGHAFPFWKYCIRLDKKPTIRIAASAFTSRSRTVSSPIIHKNSAEMR